MASSFEELIREINYQKNREVKHFSEESGFVYVSSITFWIDLFVHHFVKSNDLSHDDLLFFVRKKQTKGTKYIPRYETIIDVLRKDSKNIPFQDNEIDWEETLYLNLIMQQFEYSMTCAVCTRTSPNELQILKRHTQKVFASPSKRSMDCKGENEQISYPNIFFTVDNFDELLSQVVVYDGEMVCVELLAKDRHSDIEGVIFLGSIHYEALKRIHDARSSVTAKFGRRSPKPYYHGKQRIEFVRMRGPAGRGLAEMAIAKYKEANFYVETPTEEPGFSITDFQMEDEEMEVLRDEKSLFYSIVSSCVNPMDNPYSSQDQNQYSKRRMSDPSSNLKNCITNWQQKREVKKAQSESDGLDSIGVKGVNGINEIEAGDVRDELDETYNKCWSRKGFKQAYYFWKENKRISSAPLHSYLTYITLPWHSIIGDLLSNSRQHSILTF